MTTRSRKAGCRFEAIIWKTQRCLWPWSHSCVGGASDPTPPQSTPRRHVNSSASSYLVCGWGWGWGSASGWEQQHVVVPAPLRARRATVLVRVVDGPVVAGLRHRWRARGHKQRLAVGCAARCAPLRRLLLGRGLLGRCVHEVINEPRLPVGAVGGVRAQPPLGRLAPDDGGHVVAQLGPPPLVEHQVLGRLGHPAPRR